jgi:putative oxidoreductase
MVATVGPLVFPEGKADVARDAALVVIRIVLTWIFFYYGTGKLFGTFNLGGISPTAHFFANTAHLKPGGLFAVLAGVIEFGGALAIAIGLFSRLAALALLGDQVIAMITVTWAGGIGSLAGRTGYEFNIALAAMALVVVLLGAGRLSADHFIARRILPGRSPTPLRRGPDAPVDQQVA